MFTSYIEISQLICLANQLTGFYKRETLVVNRLNKSSPKSLIKDSDRNIRTTSTNGVLLSLLMALNKKLSTAKTYFARIFMVNCE